MKKFFVREDTWPYKSTTPKTPEGKAVVRYNALKHGILAKEVVRLSPFSSVCL